VAVLTHLLVEQVGQAVTTHFNHLEHYHQVAGEQHQLAYSVVVVA
jgi:hypothetical protein